MSEIAETKNARRVLSHAKDSSKGFLQAFKSVRQARGAGRGAPTDEEQDLARASLVFAAAGLDSCIKHLIKECLESLSNCDTKVKELFLKFAKKVVKDDSPDRLVAAILSESPRQKLLESYIYELTGSSLQSFDELAKAAGALGVSVEKLTKKKSKIQTIFETRNKIIHELDVKFDAEVGQRERNSRSKATLEEDSKTLLDIAEEFVIAVENKLKC
ncbi:MAG: HEPN domain-containing protein [Opitutales bacterium]|nr:HEPN domain-containing protein [Opitutales bacterium]